MAERIRVLVADDMQPIREYLALVLGHEADMEVVAAVGTGAEAVRRAREDRPDVALMDLEMETQRAGVEAIRVLAAEDPGVRCVVLTHFEDDETVFAAFEAGAVDYVLKNASTAEILEAVRAAARNMSPIRPVVARLIREEFRALRKEVAGMSATLNVAYRLTPTELSILRLMAEGRTQTEIAALRGVEASTVRTHAVNILRKFNAATIKEIVARLRRLGIFEIFTGAE
ncbi:MAG: response regulator [Patescibacteria group bacterium]